MLSGSVSNERRSDARASAARFEDELRELSGQLINAHEQERIRLARELHDDVAQRVSLLAIELTVLARESGNLPSNVNDRLTQFSSYAAAPGGDVHRLSHQLRRSRP